MRPSFQYGTKRISESVFAAPMSTVSACGRFSAPQYTVPSSRFPSTASFGANLSNCPVAVAFAFRNRFSACAALPETGFPSGSYAG